MLERHVFERYAGAAELHMLYGRPISSSVRYLLRVLQMVQIHRLIASMFQCQKRGVCFKFRPKQTSG